MSNTITLPGGITLNIPTGGQLLGSLNQQQALPWPTNLPPIPTNALPIDPTLLSQLAPALTAANPQLSLILTIVGVLFQVAHALHTQSASQPAGSNPSLDAIAQQFFGAVTKAFPLPIPQQASVGTPTAG
jgi:hypothetical protein